MATCRTAINRALRMLGTVSLGDDPALDELTVAMEAISGVLRALENGRGPLLEVDLSLSTDIPGENQRVRVQDTDTATITLPNSVPMTGVVDPYDFGFVAGAAFTIPAGSTEPADGITLRPPRDGSRIEIVGTTQGTYWYRSDTNAWVQATDLTIDADLPINARYDDAFACLLAERLEAELRGQITPTLQRRITRARLQLLTQSGTARDPVIATYF